MGFNCIYTTEMLYGLMPCFWYFLISYSQVKIMCFTNVSFVLEHNNIRLNDTLNECNEHKPILLHSKQAPGGGGGGGGGGEGGLIRG